MAALSLGEFRRKVGEIVATLPPVEIPPGIAEHIPGLLLNGDLLDAAARACPPAGYGRNVMCVCPEGRFSILSMVWPPGFATPIHDHRTWCAFGVYEGRMEESRYLTAHDAPKCGHARLRAVNDQGPGAAGFLPIEANIHRMRNTTGRTAISIHVYGGDSRVLGPNLERIYKEAESG